MSVIKLGTPTIATVQKVGNKLNEEGIAFASKADDITSASEFISALIKNTFRFDVFSRLYAIDDLDSNNVYRFVRNIFSNKECFVSQSNNLARHLYDQSIHPNIINGEFYVIYIEDCYVNGQNADALLLLKTEIKDSFLTVTYENGEYSIKPQFGLSTKHIDKGCLIFNIEKDNGYLLSIVENSSTRQDGRYWTQNFLYAKEIISDFQHTENVANFCAALVQKVIEINPKRALDLAKASRSITQRLQKNGSEINTTDLISSLALDEDTTSVLSQFRHDYEEKVGKIPDKFVCNQSALKRKTITKSNILRVGSGFEVKILDPSAEIDQGYDDEKGKSFLKLYF